MVWSSLVKQYKCFAVSRLSALDAAEETANWIVNKAKLLHSQKHLWQYIGIIAAKQQPPLSYSKVMVKCLREIPAIGSKAICGMSKSKCLPFTLHVTCLKYHSLQQLLLHAALHCISVGPWRHHGPFKDPNWYTNLGDASEVKCYHHFIFQYMGMGQNPIPLVNIKIAGKCMFIPLKMVCIGIDP